MRNGKLGSMEWLLEVNPCDTQLIEKRNEKLGAMEWLLEVNLCATQLNENEKTRNLEKWDGCSKQIRVIHN